MSVPEELTFKRSEVSGVETNVPRKKIVHSPSGFEWGYAGSGPADLALNILLLLVDEDTALRFYQQFKFEVVEKIPYEGGTLKTEDVRKWLDERGAFLKVVKCGRCLTPLSDGQEAVTFGEGHYCDDLCVAQAVGTEKVAECDMWCAVDSELITKGESYLEWHDDAFCTEQCLGQRLRAKKLIKDCVIGKKEAV
jgi:hypothetical protein